MDNTFTFEELLNMTCCFARQVNNEQLFLSFMATVFKAHTTEYGINASDYVGSFARFIKFSESPFSDKMMEIFRDSIEDTVEDDCAGLFESLFDNDKE